MGTESPSELPGIKPSICKIRMFLRGSNVSRKQQREDPAVLDARSASGQQAGGGLWAGGLREGAGAGRGGQWKREPREADGEEDRARETRRGLGRNAETASDAPPGKPRARSEGGRLGLVDSRWTATEHFLSVRGSARLRYYVPVSRELNLLADGSPCWRNGRT